MGFEVVGCEVAEGRMPTFSIRIGGIMAAFQSGFGELGEAAAVEQLGLKSALKGFSVGTIVAVAPT
jgi:hypothetical protein